MEKRRVVVVLILPFKSINCLTSKFFLISKLSLQKYCVNWSWRNTYLIWLPKHLLEANRKHHRNTKLFKLQRHLIMYWALPVHVSTLYLRLGGTCQMKGQNEYKARRSECHLMMVSSIYKREVHPWNLDSMSA